MESTTQRAADAVLERGDKLEAVLLKTEALKKNSIRFNKYSTKVNHNTCPSLYSFFSGMYSSISKYVTGAEAAPPVQEVTFYKKMTGKFQ